MKNLNLSRAEFVNRCYRVMMNKEADSAGRQFWIDYMTNGVSNIFVVKGFVQSQEFTNICMRYGYSKR